MGTLSPRCQQDPSPSNSVRLNSPCLFVSGIICGKIGELVERSAEVQEAVAESSPVMSISVMSWAPALYAGAHVEMSAAVS